RAVEEDNDDLVPLIDLYSRRLAALYGNYYVAELLTPHPSAEGVARHIVVAEHRGVAVSVMVLNDVANYEQLNEEFELTPFNGLRKRSDDDDIELQTLSQPEVILSQEANDFAEEESDGDRSLKFASSYEEDDDYLVEVVDSDSDYSLVFTSSDLFVFDEEDEEERELATELADSLSSYEILKEMEKVKTYEVDPRLTYVDMMEKLSKSMISTRSRTAHVPKFCGRGNAFSIEVAATHPDHEIGLYHVLEAVFECYPDRDYAVISTPTSCRSEQWMERFNRVAPRPASNHAYDLFVCHRSSLLGELECQVAGREHMAEVYTLLSTIPTRAIVLSHFEIFMEFENSPYQCFVFLCEGHVVGTAVVSEEYNVEYIDAQYDIASWVPLSCYRSGSYGLIESLILSPIFHNSGRFFKRELHRLSDFQVLFYKQRAYDKGASRERPIPNLLHWLQPVLPRRMPEYDLKMFAEEGYHVSDALIRRDHYALYMSTVSQSSMQRYSINTRIVVVGCSNTAYAFLEALLIRQHNPHYMVGGACPPPVTVPVTPPWLQINFNNVVLVCPDGVHSKLPKKIKELFSVQKNFMTERYMEMISLKTYIGVVTGNLTQINRYFLVGSQPDVFSLTSATQ
ncbi:hypothetical protein D910_07211, partial [Dendroctonus ponderosae]